MKAETLLKELIQFKTINDPARGIRPDPDILFYTEQLVKEWNPELKVTIFEDQGYSSIFFAENPIKIDILLMGHFDVVPVSDGWSSDPFTLRIDSKSGLGYARGSKDCKGSVVSALLMLEKFSKEKNPFLKRIGFFLSLDEESGGRSGAKVFFDHISKNPPKFVINVDGGPRVVHKRRAGFGVKINLPPKLIDSFGMIKQQQCNTRIIGEDNRHSAYFVRGCDSHAVVSFSKLLHLHRDWRVKEINGAWIKGNVIPDYIEASIVQLDEGVESKVTYDENLTHILQKIRSLILIDLPTEVPSEFGITVNPNLISYSTTEGVEVYFDVRAFISSEKTKMLVDAFKQRLEGLAPEVVISCPGTSGFFHTPIDSSLVKIATTVLEKYSLFSEACEQEGASDARYANGIPVIDLGPKGGNIHGNNEFIDLESMKEFASIYEEIVSLLIRPKSA